MSKEIIPKSIWHDFRVSLRTAYYAGTFGSPVKSVGRQISSYRDKDAYDIVKSIAIFDIKHGITPKQGLGLEEI